jgi:hypothetical protein
MPPISKSVPVQPLSLATSNYLINFAADHRSIADDIKALLDYYGVEPDKFEPKSGVAFPKLLSLATGRDLVKATADHPSIADDIKVLLDHFRACNLKE